MDDACRYWLDDSRFESAEYCDQCLCSGLLLNFSCYYRCSYNFPKPEVLRACGDCPGTDCGLVSGQTC